MLRRRGKPKDHVRAQLRQEYLQILQRSTKGLNNQKTLDNTIRLRRIVGPLVLLAEPLASGALAKILGEDENEINKVLDGLKSVLDILEDGSLPVRPLHSYFREFLVDEQNPDAGDYAIDQEQVHLSLAHQCVRLLAEPGSLHQDICHVEEPGARRLDLTFEQVAACIPSPIAYACSYWPQHLVASGTQLVDGGAIHDFLRKHFLH